MPILKKCIICGKETLDKNVTLIKSQKNTFCSQACYRIFRGKSIKGNCGNCGKEMSRWESEFKKSKSGLMFCSHRCSVIYSNSHKTTGTRISKLEIYLQEQLTRIYPQVNFLFNDKTIINSELDIYLPDFKLAFELNGIFHYEPIYGAEKLSQIQNNDHRKYQACLENEIELVIIDSSGLKYFKETNAKKYLDIVIDIIDRKLNNTVV